MQPPFAVKGSQETVESAVMRLGKTAAIKAGKGSDETFMLNLVYKIISW
jgi:hypothetical protein